MGEKVEKENPVDVCELKLPPALKDLKTGRELSSLRISWCNQRNADRIRFVAPRPGIFSVAGESDQPL